jgi:hypothetical protein
MELMRQFAILDKLLDPIPTVHGLDAFTRLQARIGNVPGVERVSLMNTLYWDTHNHVFAWHYLIERRLGVGWDDLAPRVYAACSDFFAACTPPTPQEKSS